MALLPWGTSRRQTKRVSARDGRARVPSGTRRAIDRNIPIRATETLDMPKHKEQRRPPRRARSRTTKRQRRESKINGIRPRRTARQVRPKERRDEVAFQEMATGTTITATGTVLRLTRKPSKTPADKKRTFCTRGRHKEDGINHQSRATCA